MGYYGHEFQILKLVTRGVTAFFSDIFQNYLSIIGFVRLHTWAPKIVHSLESSSFKPIYDENWFQCFIWHNIHSGASNVALMKKSRCCNEDAQPYGLSLWRKNSNIEPSEKEKWSESAGKEKWKKKQKTSRYIKKSIKKIEKRIGLIFLKNGSKTKMKKKLK